jgi:hypothetical protein
MWSREILLPLAAWMGRSVAHWLQRSRLTCPRPDSRVLEFPRSHFLFGAAALFLCILLTAADLVAFFIMQGAAGFAMDLLIVVGLMSSLTCTAGCVFIVLEYFRVRFRLEPGGMAYQTVLASPGFLHWIDVSRIHRSRFGWFQIEKSDGTIIRVSIMLAGLPAFAAVVLDLIPGCCIDAYTEKVLKQVAVGRLPPLLGD